MVARSCLSSTSCCGSALGLMLFGHVIRGVVHMRIGGQLGNPHKQVVVGCICASFQERASAASAFVVRGWGTRSEMRRQNAPPPPVAPPGFFGTQRIQRPPKAPSSEVLLRPFLGAEAAGEGHGQDPGLVVPGHGPHRKRGDSAVVAARVKPNAFRPEPPRISEKHGVSGIRGSRSLCCSLEVKSPKELQGFNHDLKGLMLPWRTLRRMWTALPMRRLEVLGTEGYLF